MTMIPQQHSDLNSLIMVGDRVLIKPVDPPAQSPGGLYLPAGLHKKETVHSGYVVKAGPGYPIPSPHEPDEFWKKDAHSPNYLALQAREGDLAVYLQREAIEVVFNAETYVIVPHSAILLLHRDEDLLV